MPGGRSASVPVASGFTYRPFGPVAGLLFGNGIGLTLGYDNDGRLTAIDSHAGSTQIQNLAYAYDDASNITAITDLITPARSQTFTYDDLNRLDTVTGPTTADYGYDGVGNRTSMVQSSPTAATDTYTYNSAANRLLSIARSGGFTRTFTWYASGQMASDTRDATTAYTYSLDAAGRLRTVRLNGTVTASYAYDASERRVSKTAGSVVTHSIYDLSGRLIAEANGATGGTTREYIWADDLPIGLVGDVATTPVLYFVHADHLNQPQRVTNAAKSVVWNGQFRPFGEVRVISGSLTLDLRFPGQFFDAETLLHQNWHRDYDPTTGRYIQSDPVGLAGGINTYVYAGGNPLVRYDVAGLDCTAIDQTVTCHVPDGPTIEFPRPEGWPDYIGPGSRYYHHYDKPVASSVSDSARLLLCLARFPTPGSDTQPATPEGTLNDATPDLVTGALMAFLVQQYGEGALSLGPLMLNPVKSYVVDDSKSGTQVVVNVTMKDHQLAFGYVARYITSSGSGSIIHNAGEGNGILQSSSNIFADILFNDIWYYQTPTALGLCGCAE